MFGLPMPPVSSPHAAPTRGDPRGAAAGLLALPPRDRALVLAVARMRVLTYGQAGRLLFPERHASIVTRRARTLVRAGWLRRVRPRVERGGAPSYLLPSARGLAGSLDLFLAEAEGTILSVLVRRLVPTRPRRPLVLTATSSLAHQREVNELLVAYARASEFRVLWASSWERPFGRGPDAALLPQPDYVLVIERAGVPVLIFGEHDRGHESLAHFRATKADRYAPFALLPDTAATDFGISAVEVWITVTDPVARQPRRRLQHLADVILAAGAAPITRLALAGAASARPATAFASATALHTS
jgi:protein involved in plasmid replication-relaxation